MAGVGGRTEKSKEMNGVFAAVLDCSRNVNR